MLKIKLPQNMPLLSSRSSATHAEPGSILEDPGSTAGMTESFYKLSKVSILLLTLFFAHSSYSLDTDNNKELIIKSQKFEINYASGEAYYTGNVKLNQGTRDLASDTLYVYFDQNKKSSKKTSSKPDKIKEIRALGAPVTYHEKLKKNTSEKLYAEARVMKLLPKEDLLTLEKEAIIEQNGRRLTSELLHYNIKKEVAYLPKVKGKKSTKLILG